MILDHPHSHLRLVEHQKQLCLKVEYQKDPPAMLRIQALIQPKPVCSQIQNDVKGKKVHKPQYENDYLIDLMF